MTAVTKSINREVLSPDHDEAFLDKAPSEGLEQLVKAGLDRLVQHSARTADCDPSQKMREVNNMLNTNQNVRRSFNGVTLKRKYVVGANEIRNTWYE